MEQAVEAGPLERQMERLREVFPGAELIALPDGTSLVRVPVVPLVAGWSQPQTTVSFLAPVGYPAARPDCFYADPSLRLASGQLPQNSAPQEVPHLQEARLWFSWHLATWNPLQDSFLTYVRVIQDRLGRAL